MSVKLAPSDAPENVITVSTEVANMSVTIKNMLEGMQSWTVQELLEVLEG
jgi:Skp1 family, tetramerisation domain